MNKMKIIDEVLNRCYTDENYELDDVIEKLEEFKKAQQQVKNNVGLGDVGNCTLSKECLEKWMWKYAKEIEDTDNIIGLHGDTNFRKWLADNLMNEYYC